METLTHPKPKMTTDISFGFGRQIDAQALADMAQSNPGLFARKIEEMVQKGEMTLRDIKNLPRLFNRLVDIEVPAQIEIGGEQRTITSSAFPLFMGNLTIAGINAAYNIVPTIGEQLVQDFESNKKVTEIAGITELDTNIDKVLETYDFPEIGAGEERYEIRHRRNGRRLSITAEAIEENDMPGFIDRVNTLGKIAAERVEEQTLRRVTDNNGSAATPGEPYVLRPNGAGVALYQTDADPLSRLPSDGNRIVNNALVDITDLEAARARLAGMRSSSGSRIALPLSRMILLVPDALASTAITIQGSEMIAGVANEENPWGPRGPYRPRILSSPRLDDLSTTAWYLGDFQSQFRRKWKLRFEYVTLGMDTESFLRSRLAFQARIAWDVEIGAVDYVYVVQNLTATTPPTAQ